MDFATDCAGEAQLARISAQIREQYMEKQQASGGADLGEPKEARDKRIALAKIFAKGVAEFRQQQPSLPVGRSAHRVGTSIVFVRARPLFEHESTRGEWECVSASPQQRGVVVHEGLEKLRNSKGLTRILRHHAFPDVESIANDEAVRENVQYMVTRVLEGEMSTLFMFGMTGSGKTYSMDVIHRTAPYDLFAHLGAGSVIKLIAYELIGKRCFDLLCDTKNEVNLRVGEDGATHVSGNVSQMTHGPEELCDFLRAAAERRETATTGTNFTSSRSHAVYQLITPSGGSLMLIDLAGNEGNIETFYHSKEQMAEAAYINSSLMALNACLHARAIGASHIPFRQNILTRVLRDALLKPDAATAVIACVSPACSHLERTLWTLNSAVKLLGEGHQACVRDQELVSVSVRMGGPSHWDRESLLDWLQNQPFASKIDLPAGVNGASIMKLAASRLTAMCNGDQEVAKELFAALRAAAKEAAQLDLKLRQQQKGEKRSEVSSLEFSKSAPAKPVVAKVPSMSAAV